MSKRLQGVSVLLALLTSIGLLLGLLTPLTWWAGIGFMFTLALAPIIGANIVYGFFKIVAWALDCIIYGDDA